MAELLYELVPHDWTVLVGRLRPSTSRSTADVLAALAKGRLPRSAALKRCHPPCRWVPPGTLNVLGRLYGREAPTRPHIELSVERTDYVAIGLTWALDLARRRNV